MTAQARLDERCPFCGAFINRFPKHIPECPERDRVLADLEERARQVRRGKR